MNFLKKIVFLPFLQCLILTTLGQKVSLLKPKVNLDSLYKDTLIIQRALEPIITEIDKLNSSSVDLVSQTTLNTFFVNKFTYFLTRKEDVGFLKTYAFLNTSDGTLILGRNSSILTKDTKRLKGIFSYSLKADIADNFATIFKNDELSSNLGLSLKYTKIFRGSIGYDSYKCTSCEQKEKMGHFRNQTYFEIQKLLAREGKQMYLDSLTNAKLVGKGLLQKDSNKGYLKSLKAKYLKKLYEREYEILLNEELYKSFHQSWVTIGGFIPITSTKYDVKDDILSTTVNNYNFRPWEANLTYNYAFGTTKSSNLIQITTNLKKSNSINTGGVISQSIGTTKYLTPIVANGDTLYTKNQVIKYLDKSEKSLVGKYEDFFVWNLGIRGLFYPKKWDGEDTKYGINISLDYIKTNGTGRTDFGFGIPISAKGKDKGTLINYEFNLTVQDIFNTNGFTAGISVGVPLEKFKF